MDLCVSVMFVGVNTDGTYAWRRDELPILWSCDRDSCLCTEMLSIPGMLARDSSSLLVLLKRSAAAHPPHKKLNK